MNEARSQSAAVAIGSRLDVSFVMETNQNLTPFDNLIFFAVSALLQDYECYEIGRFGPYYSRILLELC